MHQKDRCFFEGGDGHGCFFKEMGVCRRDPRAQDRGTDRRGIHRHDHRTRRRRLGHGALHRRSGGCGVPADQCCGTAGGAGGMTHYC